MFESGLFFNQDYEISAFCGGKGSRLSYGELEHICREYELRQGEAMLKDKISIANYAIAFFIDEFLQGIPLPEGIVMSEDIKNLIQVLENKKKYGI